MLKDCEDGIATLPAQDISRARSFYEGTLGFTPVEDSPDGGVFYQAGSTRFLVFPSMGKASGDHTQIGFSVNDIVAEVEALKKNAVRFEEYDLPDFKTEGGIAKLGDERSAWFKDSEGNLIALFEQAKVAATP
jgi:catechol 2,3-dioxygenase-like lactoylglutathione lyase family enzyme